MTDNVSQDERRREHRLSGSSARFIVKNPARSFDNIICRVVNLSRLGLGVELPADVPVTNSPVGSQIEGTLIVGHQTLQAKAFVRVRNKQFVGLEYEAKSGAFMRALLNILSPGYIAESIYRVSNDYLRSDVEYAYRGDEFECVLFKSGNDRPHKVLQIFTAGSVVEVTPEGARFVPNVMIRRMGTYGSYDFISEFKEFQSSNSSIKLARFFLWVDQICEHWSDCPEEIREMVSARLERIVKKKTKQK